MESWFQLFSVGRLLGLFQALLPVEWSHLSTHQASGEIRWVRKLFDGFVLELGVHPVIQNDKGFLFQTNLYLKKTDLLEIEAFLGFDECIGDLSRSRNEIFASIYLEGLQRLLKGGRIALLQVDPFGNVCDGERWKVVVADGVAQFGIEAGLLSENILKLDVLSMHVSPSPIAIYGNPFILAAVSSMASGDAKMARNCVAVGESQSWRQPNGGFWEHESVTRCKAEKLAAVDFRLPGN